MICDGPLHPRIQPPLPSPQIVLPAPSHYTLEFNPLSLLLKLSHRTIPLHPGIQPPLPSPQSLRLSHRTIPLHPGIQPPRPSPQTVSPHHPITPWHSTPSPFSSNCLTAPSHYTLEFNPLALLLRLSHRTIPLHPGIQPPRPSPQTVSPHHPINLCYQEITSTCTMVPTL